MRITSKITGNLNINTSEKGGGRWNFTGHINVTMKTLLFIFHSFVTL